jgi:hypothetical protein
MLITIKKQKRHTLSIRCSKDLLLRTDCAARSNVSLLTAILSADSDKFRGSPLAGLATTLALACTLPFKVLPLVLVNPACFSIISLLSLQGVLSKVASADLQLGLNSGRQTAVREVSGATLPKRYGPFLHAAAVDSNISALEMPEEHPDRSFENVAGRMSFVRCEVADEVFVAPKLNPNPRPESNCTDIAAICDVCRVDWLQQPLPKPARCERLKQWGERRLSRDKSTQWLVRGQ